LNAFTPLLTSLGILLVGHGVQLSLLPLFARGLGWSDAEIGITGAMYYFGFIVGCLMVPRMLSSSGHIRVFLSLAGLSAACLLILEVTTHYWLWLCLRFFMGWCLSAIYVTTESWLNEHSTNETRGKVISVYVMVTLVGIAVGQQLLAILPFDILFRASAAIMLISLLPLGLFAKEQPMNLQSTSLNFSMLKKIPPVALGGIFFGGIVTGSLWTMAPLLGDSKGLSPGMIAYMMNAIVLGGALFQYPLGAVSDVVGRIRLVGFISVGCICSTLFVLTSSGVSTTELIVVMFVFGGTSLTLYALCTADAHDKSDLSRIEISAVLLLLNSAGAMLGPIITGVLSIYFENALFIVAVMSMLGLLMLITARSPLPESFEKLSKKRQRNPIEMATDAHLPQAALKVVIWKSDQPIALVADQELAPKPCSTSLMVSSEASSGVPELKGGLGEYSIAS
jgi:MFS family permease